MPTYEFEFESQQTIIVEADDYDSAFEWAYDEIKEGFCVDWYLRNGREIGG